MLVYTKVIYMPENLQRHSISMDCRASGSRSLPDPNSISITKTYTEDNLKPIAVEVACHYLSPVRGKCLVSGSDCPHLNPKTKML